MQYNRFKDFSDLLEKIDCHCFVGDTLNNAEARKEFAQYLGRWERSLKSREELALEIAEDDRLQELEEEKKERQEEALEVVSMNQKKLIGRLTSMIDLNLTDAYIEAVAHCEFGSYFGIQHIVATLKKLRG